MSSISSGRDPSAGAPSARSASPSQTAAVNWAGVDLTGPRTPESFQIDSAALGDSLEVSVSMPSISPQGDAVALYLLDPAFYLHAAVAVVHVLGTFARLTGSGFPPIAVVGVGYPARDAATIFSLRARDLTPTAEGWPAEVGLPSIRHGFGGASLFLDAVTNEVIPNIEARFPIRRNERAIAGVSFGGLFGLYTLFHRPESFSHYLLVSPSIWWRDRIVLHYESRWAEGHRDLPARVFLGVGEQEVQPDDWKNEGFSAHALQAFRMVENTRELAVRLQDRNYPSLQLSSAVLPSEFHLTVFPAAVMRGLVALFDT